MSITVTIDLSDRDLEHFQKAMETSRKAAEGKTPDEVVVAAGKLLADAQKVHIPDFVRERLLQLDDMIAMVRDQGRSDERGVGKGGVSTCGSRRWPCLKKK